MLAIPRYYLGQALHALLKCDVTAGVYSSDLVQNVHATKYSNNASTT